MYVLTALLVGFLYQSLRDLYVLRNPAAAFDEKWAKLEALCRDEPAVPIMIGSGLRYLEARQYAPASLQSRLVHVANPELAVRFTGTDSADETNLRLSQFTPLELQQIAPFEAAHRRFILYSDGGTCMRPWVKEQIVMVNSIFNGARREDVWLDK